MGCCGETRQPGEERQVQAEPTPFMVNQQPSPHPGLQPFQEKPFSPPHINSPPAAQHFNGQANSYGMQQQQFMQQQWAGNDPRGGGMNQMGTPSNMGSNMPMSPPGSYTPLLDPNVIRPSPVHASRPTTPMTVTSPLMSRTVNSQSPPNAQDEGRVSVSIDFGASFIALCGALLNGCFYRDNVFRCGTYMHVPTCIFRLDSNGGLQAYGSSRIAAGKVQQILHWPGSFETFRKVPTCLLYDDQGHVLAWGLEAKNASPMPGTLRCEW